MITLNILHWFISTESVMTAVFLLMFVFTMLKKVIEV